MLGAQILIQALEREGVDVVFGYPGGAIMPVYDALVDTPLKHVLVRHEQAAVLAADGYARATGRVGVCLATSGPGATNLITGIANAYSDSVPLVAVTGQVPTASLGTDAFQEVDILGMTWPVVKHSFLVRSASELAETVHEGFRLARSGRPGPVLVDLPKDVATAHAPAPSAWPLPPDEAPAPPEPLLEEARRLLAAAERPVVYAGGGVGIARAVDAFRRFVEVSGLPVVTTLKGVGALPSEHSQHLGMLGMHGTAAANRAVQASDLLVAVGVRFDDRATGKLSEFAPDARVVHLDIDPSEIGKLRPASVGLAGALVPSLEALTAPCRVDAWRARCVREKESHARGDSSGEGVSGPRLVRELTRMLGPEAVITCDVGQHQMWVAQHGVFSRPERHLSSGGLGTMGYGLPAAIGAHFGDPARPVVNVTGDGSMMMNFQELATVGRYRVPVKIVVLDNQALGLVRQWQELFFGERYSEVDLRDNPDFVRVAEAFGVEARALEAREDERSALEWLRDGDGPQLLHVKMDRDTNVWPLVPPNCSNAEMLMGGSK